MCTPQTVLNGLIRLYRDGRGTQSGAAVACSLLSLFLCFHAIHHSLSLSLSYCCPDCLPSFIYLPFICFFIHSISLSLFLSPTHLLACLPLSDFLLSLSTSLCLSLHPPHPVSLFSL